ncbi:MAG: M1 family peptidase, partial [Chitinophagaceae bacterium]
MKLFLSLFLLTAGLTAFAQENTFSHADTLRGSNGPFRERWDVMHYDLTVEPDLVNKTIKGKNIITFFDNGAKLMQIDLMEPMVLDSVINDAAPLSFRREGNVYWVMLRDSNAMYKMRPDTNRITLYFHGKPKESKKAPWDGGWVWKKDSLGRPWATVACQGFGASSWYPCKDWQGDEPDKGATLRIITPDSLIGVGNGRLTSRQGLPENRMMYSWQVVNPINNYNIAPYIGKYVHFGEKYEGEKGKLDMDYWVLDYNLELARKQFKEAPRMMKAFEYWFGPYPFYADGFKLVESSHLGMEHQSAIAYGNHYQNGFYGSDLSGTGEGLKWDFIIVHEAGHEWFGNNITAKDIADMWI